MSEPDRHCGKCKTWKPAVDFPARACRPSGRASRCTECNRKYNREYGRRRRADALPKLPQGTALTPVPAMDRDELDACRSFREAWRYPVDAAQLTWRIA
jgi:hypothetical protein